MIERTFRPPREVDQSHSMLMDSKVTMVTCARGVCVDSGFKVIDCTYWFSRYSWTSDSKLNVS